MMVLTFIMVLAGNLQVVAQKTGKGEDGSRRLTYQGDGGYTFVVEFLPSADSVLLIMAEKTLRLTQVPAASGAKYSDGRTVFWSKGEEAFLEVDGKIQYRGCKVKME